MVTSAFPCSPEVLQGQYVPYVFSMFRMGLGLGSLIGPPVAGKSMQYLKVAIRSTSPIEAPPLVTGAPSFQNPFTESEFDHF